MEFLKKNYEKVLLVVVLVGLTVASCLLPFIISGKRAALESQRVNTKAVVKPLPLPDMSVEEAAMQRVQAPATFDYTNKHNLLNPVLWKRTPDGRLLKETAGPEDGVSLLQITALKPLYLIVSYGSQSGAGYLISVERQAALSEGKRHSQSFVSKESKSELLTLTDVKGPPDKPTEMDFEWTETGSSISNSLTLSATKPYKQIEGYAVDLKYPPEPGKAWNDRRANSPDLMFANGRYKIVAITESNIVVLAESNKKKTTITFHPANETR